MVYAYKRKSTRGSWSVEEMMMSAIRSIRNDGVAVREGVRRFHVPRATLQRHLKTGGPVPRLGFFKPVFTLIRNTSWHNTYSRWTAYSMVLQWRHLRR